jgi:hypothetical protein
MMPAHPGKWKNVRPWDEQEVVTEIDCSCGAFLNSRCHLGQRAKKEKNYEQLI